jgi:hypothetical protein
MLNIIVASAIATKIMLVFAFIVTSFLWACFYGYRSRALSMSSGGIQILPAD